MKIIRNLGWLAAVLAVSGCQTGPSAPAQPVAPLTIAQAGGAPPAAPTVAPAADLAAGYAAFPGLYWTSEQMATGNENMVSVLSARPCAELLDVLSAGEWRATQRLDSPPGVFRFPSLLLLERGEAVALARADSINPVTTTVTAEASPLTIGEQCRAQVTRLSRKPVLAEGAESAQGEAWTYPLLGGCRIFKAGTLEVLDAALMYEGPGDFRAILTMELPAPVGLGEHALDPQALTLSVFRSEQTYFDILREGYAQILAGQEMKPQAMAGAREFSAASETPGTVTVTGLAPLEGEVDIPHLVDEAGTPQTFRAGFRCDR